MTLNSPPRESEGPITNAQVTGRVKIRRSTGVRDKKKRARRLRRIVIAVSLAVIGVILIVFLMKHLIYDANSVRPPTIQTE